MLKCGLEFLKKDFETEVFVLYFEEKYAKNLKVWAYCYHLHVGLNTNMHIERMHKSIKYFYLKGKNVNRLDKTLNAIMTFVRDKLVGRLIMIYKGKLSSKFQDLRRRHKASINLQTPILKTKEG